MKARTGSVAAIALLWLIVQPAFAGDCTDGHWLQSKSDDGTIVILEDGSVWQVDSGDAVDSSVWTESDSIVACDDKLIDTDDGTTVDATRIKGPTSVPPHKSTKQAKRK